MDRKIDRTEAPVIVDGDLIRVPNPYKKGTFVSFEVEGLNDQAILELDKLDNPKPADLLRYQVEFRLLPDPETSALAEKRGFEITDEIIATNLDLPPYELVKIRKRAIKAFLDSRKRK